MSENAKCPICGEDLTTVIEFGGVRHTVKCTCKCEREKNAEQEQRFNDQQQEYSIRIAKKASIEDVRSRSASFDGYQVTDGNRTAYKTARAFVDRFDKIRSPTFEKQRGLLLYGQPGTGKTYTAACILNELMEQGWSGLMTSIPRLIDQFQNFNVDSWQLLRDIQNVAILIIDDLGVEGSSDFRLEKAFEIIDTRYGADRPTIFTTNLSLNEIKGASDIRYKRIYDRVLGMCYPVQVSGESHRR